MRHDDMPIGSERPHPLVSQVRQHLLSFLAPLLCTLDHQLDHCLVVTFVEILQALLIWRHCNLGLLLVSSAARMATPGHAPVCTKPLSNLLRSKNWQADLIVT